LISSPDVRFTVFVRARHSAPVAVSESPAGDRVGKRGLMSDTTRRKDELGDLVGETMSSIAEEAKRRNADEQQEIQRQARRAARRRIAAGTAVLACVLLTALNLAGFDWLGGEAGLPQTSAEARETATMLLRDAIEELQQAHERDGRYPATPGFIGPDGSDGEDEPFGYELIGNTGYVLSVTVGDVTVSHDSRREQDEPPGLGEPTS
jgi:hypothetical protein